MDTFHVVLLRNSIIAVNARIIRIYNGAARIDVGDLFRSTRPATIVRDYNSAKSLTRGSTSTSRRASAECRVQSAVDHNFINGTSVCTGC